MSWQATAWVIEKSRHKGSALLTLLCIANCANETGTDAFPGLPRLAKDTRMSLRQVGRIVEKLEVSGELTVRRVEGRVHHYSLPLMTPAKMSGVRNSATPDKSALTPDILGVTPDTAMSPDPSVRTISKNSHKASRQEKPIAPQIPPPFHGEAFLQVLREFEAQRKDQKKPLVGDGRKRMFARFETWGEQVATEALEESVINTWTGVFLPKNQNGRNGNNGNGSSDRPVWMASGK